MIEERDALPCPKCGSKNIEVFANVVACLDCDTWGPEQEMPEILCDWRIAIEEWNEIPRDLK